MSCSLQNSAMISFIAKAVWLCVFLDPHITKGNFQICLWYLMIDIDIRHFCKLCQSLFQNFHHCNKFLEKKNSSEEKDFICVHGSGWSVQ